MTLRVPCVHLSQSPSFSNPPSQTLADKTLLGASMIACHKFCHLTVQNVTSLIAEAVLTRDLDIAR